MAVTSLEPRLSFVGGKGEPGTHCLRMRQHFRKIFSKTVRLLPANTWLGTYTAMSGENTETKIKPHEELANSWFSKD